MTFDEKWYHALKADLAGLSKSDQKVLRTIWKYPGVPVHVLPEKIGQRRGGGIWLAVGDRIAKKKLWKRMPERVRRRNQSPGYEPFYSGIIVRLTTVVDRKNKRLVCFDLHDEAERALRDLKIITGKRQDQCTDYKPVDAAEDISALISQSAPAETKRILDSIVRRQGQRKFRQELIQAYEGCCAVTGCTELSVLEAVHIHQFAKKRALRDRKRTLAEK